MNFQSTDYLKINLDGGYSAEKYLAFINTSQFANFVVQDFQSIQIWPEADKFFEEHTSFIHQFALTGRSITGIELWLGLLERLQGIDPINYNRIHKEHHIITQEFTVFLQPNILKLSNGLVMLLNSALKQIEFLILEHHLNGH